MKQILRFLAPILLLAWLGGFSATVSAGSKVTICHIPPGNPDNAHTITISESAVPAHMAHGDSTGACDGGGSSTLASAEGASYVLCDARESEMGRLVSVGLVGRIHTEQFECD